MSSARRFAPRHAGVEELQAEADAEAALRRVAVAVAREHDPGAVFGLAAGEAARLAGGTSGAVVRVGDAGTAVVGAWGADEATARALEEPGGRSGAGTERRVPIEVDGRTWGTLVVAGPALVPGPAVDGRLAEMADLVALAVGNAAHRTSLAERAASDPLTGLANHRTFHERLHAEVERARRYGRALSVVVADLDHFKKVNDTWGHQVGDDVLLEATRRIRALARPADTVARVGGEEFAWVLPETDGLGAWLAAERMRQAIAGSPFPRVGRMSISAGVCDLDRASDADELFRLADGALYWAKAHGRNVVCHYSPEVVTDLSAKERNTRLERSQALGGLRALARAVDAKDPSTFQHSERVADLAEQLAFAQGWPASRAAALKEAGLLHDVGKIGVPESILLKPSRLSLEEYEVVKGHAALGAQIAGEVLSEEQVAWLLHHHERWDGGGYPHGLGGEAVPDGARLLALADAWDVMTSARAYAEPLGPRTAFDECVGLSGRQFAPDAVEALRRLWRAGSLAGSNPPPGVAEARAASARPQAGLHLRPATGSGGDVRVLPESVTRFIELALRSDRAGATKLAEAVRRRHGPLAFFDDVLQPALREIGRRAEAGEIRAAEAHIAASVCEQLLAERARPAGAPDAPPYLIAAAPHNTHRLGPAVAAETVALAGWRPVNLGVSVPFADLAEIVERLGARAVGLSLATDADLEGFEQELPELTARVPGVTVVAGGSAVGRYPEWRPNGPVVLARSAREHYAVARELLGSGEAAPQGGS